MSRPTRNAVIGAVAALSILAAVPAAASAITTRWVSPTGNIIPNSLGTSCSSPGYHTIQSAINAAYPDTAVKICAGTYEEQLTITKAIVLKGEGGPTVKLPTPAENSLTACDEARNNAVNDKDQDLVSICTPGTVSIKGMTFEAKWPEGTCKDNLYGILVGGGADLLATKVTVDGAGAFPINGCQGGVGIQVGFLAGYGNQAGKATLTNDTVENYQKNGITLEGADAEATIKGTRVKTEPTKETANNGIQVSYGAKGTIENSTVSGNECNDETLTGSPPHPECELNYYQSAGILFYGAKAGSSVSKSKIENNDLGIYYASESATEPASPEVSITEDKLVENRYEGVYLEQGKATVNNDKIYGPALDGIYLNQYEGQPYAVEATAKEDKIKGMTEAAVYVWSDKAGGDIAGSFLLEKSSISKNKEELKNLSNNFTVTFTENT